MDDKIKFAIVYCVSIWPLLLVILGLVALYVSAAFLPSLDNMPEEVYNIFDAAYLVANDSVHQAAFLSTLFFTFLLLRKRYPNDEGGLGKRCLIYAFLGPVFCAVIYVASFFIWFLLIQSYWSMGNRHTSTF